jgi:hypothetical protein
MAQRDRLLRGIARRRADIARLTERLRETATKVAADGPLLFQELARLSKSIAQMFDAIMKDPARSKRQRKEIRAMYDDLVESGILAALSGPADLEDLPDSFEYEGNQAEFVEASPRPAAGQDGGPARALFRRLADLLHPDKVQDEGEKVRRTEVMKQVTQAYQSGDYARLVEIEQSHGHALERANELESDTHEKELVVAVAALRRQSRELDTKLRALRAQNAGEVEDAFEQAKRMVTAVRVIHDFVASFRHGKINFETFLVGPPNLDLEGLMSEDMFEDEDAAEEALFAAFDELTASAPGRRKRGRGGRHRR